MEKRRLGNSDLYPSVIGFGGWAAGRRGWGSVSEDQIQKAILTAYEQGVTFFDTAPAYGLGESEKVIGKTLKAARDSIIIATKFGWDWDESGNMWKDVSKNRILTEVEESLKRLQTDYIDLYQLHWPDPTGAVSLQETFETLQQIVESGKVRNIGVCNLSVEQLEEARKYTSITSLQSIYNLLERDVEIEELPYVEKNNLGFIPYSPIAQGILTGTFSKDTKFEEDHVRYTINPLFQKEVFEESLEKVEVLKRIAKKYEQPVGNVAINWLLANRAVSTVIVGAEHEDHVIENVAANTWKLEIEDIHYLNKVFK